MSADVKGGGLRKAVARLVDGDAFIALEETVRYAAGYKEPEFWIERTWTTSGLSTMIRIQRAYSAADAILALLPTADLLEALKELDAVLGDTPMPDCAAMNRLIAASSKAKTAVAKAEGPSS